MSDVTVIISNFNYQQYVVDAIDSCLVQKPTVKILVVDDASTDGSWKVIKKKAETNGFLAVRLSKNSGGNARGKNIGIALSKTDFVTCLDSDDMLLPNSISPRLRKLQKTDVSWVHGKAVRVNSTARFPQILQGLRAKNRWKEADMYSTDILSKPETHMAWYRGVEASTVLAKRSIYEQVGLYDEDLKWKIDREMWYRLLAHNVRKSFMRDHFVSIYRKHQRQVTKNRSVKDPSVIDSKFRKIVENRKVLNQENTLWLASYDPFQYIGEVAGDKTWI